jgi:D-glycero-alpha-D-manno-heptose-7-phosphate kinase
MIFRSKAPLRIGLAGGGTDVSPYSDKFGGCVLNATINLYAHCTLEPILGDKVEFVAKDLGAVFKDKAVAKFEIDGLLPLHKAIYNRIVCDFNNGEPLSVRVVTWVDAPIGCGLGTSSTLVVSILNAYKNWLKLPLGEYDLARLAFDIERLDCGLSGGKQDQYAATFGGFNFIEFHANDKVIVNPLRIGRSIVYELESRLMLYYTGLSRESAKIIDDQVKSVQSSNGKSIKAMHKLKNSAIKMKECILKSDIDGFTNVIRDGWEAKKATSSSISNQHVEKIVRRADSVGVKALKLSGAGGGGFMLMVIEPEDRLDIQLAFSDLEGRFYNFDFFLEGTQTWTI